MGFDIGSLVGKAVETTYELAGESAVITYDPNVLTQERIEKAEGGDQTFMEFFCDLVVDWEVTNGGAKVPLKPDALKVVPLAVLRGIFWHILRESSSGELGKVSSVGSRRKVPRDRAPRSTGTSRPRATSASRRGNS